MRHAPALAGVGKQPGSAVGSRHAGLAGLICVGTANRTDSVAGTGVGVGLVVAPTHAHAVVGVSHQSVGAGGATHAGPA